MDLKIKDVADLLNVSETTIRRWLAEGKIPAYRLNNQVRFSRIEIENWVMSNKMSSQDLPKEEMVDIRAPEAEHLVGKVGTQAFSLYRAISKGDVLSPVDGNTKKEVIVNTVKVIADNLSLDSEVLTELLMDRERLMPTGLNHGIAVPHTRDFLLQRPFDVVTVAYPKFPIEYGSLDGQKVFVLFFLFASSDKMHLHLLAKIAHLTKDPKTVAFLQQRPSKEQFLAFVKEWEGEIQPAKVYC